MADTLTVALRVAEEAIEEAIAKAESYRDSLVRNSCPSNSSKHYCIRPSYTCISAQWYMVYSFCVAGEAE